MYYVIEIAAGDARVAGKAVYEYATEKEAVATFHSKMGNAMKSELYDSELLMVCDENGILSKREKYVREIPEEVITDDTESR